MKVTVSLQRVKIHLPMHQQLLRNVHHPLLGPINIAEVLLQLTR